MPFSTKDIADTIKMYLSPLVVVKASLEATPEYLTTAEIYACVLFSVGGAHFVIIFSMVFKPYFVR